MDKKAEPRKGEVRAGGDGIICPSFFAPIVDSGGCWLCGIADARVRYIACLTLLAAMCFEDYSKTISKLLGKSENKQPTLTPQSKLAACGQRRAEYIMILPYSHSPGVQSVAGKVQGCMRTMQV